MLYAGMMNDQLLKLIDLFLHTVSQAEKFMKERMGLDEPRYWRQRGVPRTGALDKFNYSFHGIGCRFDFGDISVDYDYGDQGRIDGFDLWRLTIFGEQIKDFKSYVDSGDLKSDFEACIESGEIKKSGGKYDNLYYLPNSI